MARLTEILVHAVAIPLGYALKAVDPAAVLEVKVSAIWVVIGVAFGVACVLAVAAVVKSYRRIKVLAERAAKVEKALLTLLERLETTDTTRGAGTS